MYFNVTPVGASQAIWIGTVETSRRPFQQKLEKAGDYRIDVFLVRAEARRGGKADFALDVSVGP